MSAAAFIVSRWKRSRFWAIHDAAGELVCIVVYKRGAAELVRRLSSIEK